MFAALLVLVHSAMFVQCQRCNLDDEISQRENVYVFEADVETRFSFTCPSGFLRRNSDCVLSRSTPYQQCPALELLNLEYNINLCFKIKYNFTRVLSVTTSTVSSSVPSSSTVSTITTITATTIPFTTTTTPFAMTETTTASSTTAITTPFTSTETTTTSTTTTTNPFAMRGTTTASSTTAIPTPFTSTETTTPSAKKATTNPFTSTETTTPSTTTATTNPFTSTETTDSFTTITQTPPTYAERTTIHIPYRRRRRSISTHLGVATPNLNEVDDITITPSSEPLSEHQCSYPISQFLATSTEKNEINLTLSIDRESKRLYVDVYTERDVVNIREKVFCWGEAVDNYHPQPINLEQYIPTYNEILTSTRYSLETNDNTTLYFCTFFNPGKQKPIISNKINLLRLGGKDYTFLVPNDIFRYDGMCCGHVGVAHAAAVCFVCEAVDETTNIILIPSRGYSNISDAVKYLKHITDQVLSSPYYDGVSRNITIVSTQYCLDHNDTDNGVVWYATKIGDTTTPCENPCVDNEGNIITRTCGGDYQTGSVWFQPSSNCSANPVQSAATLSLLSKRNATVTNDLLLNVSKIINNTPSLTAIDVDSITRILSNAENQDDAENFQSSFFHTTDSVLNIKEAVFSKAFHSRENILSAIDKYVNKTVMATTNLSYTNLAITIERLKSSDQMLTVEHISAKFPKSMIEGSSDKDNFNVAMVVFKSRKLFHQGELASHVANLVIPSVSKYFHEPISIYFEHNSKYDNVVCGYWDYGKTKLGNWSIVGVQTIRHNNSNRVECQAYHLTSFVLLGVSETVIKDLSIPILKYISGVGCLLSLFGTAIILFTAIAFKNWYKRRINTLQLACVVLLEVLMLFVADITEHTQTSCVIFGTLLHYLVLAKFMLMLVIAKFQYSNFVTVMQSRNTPQYNSTYTAISLIGPLLFVIIAASVFPHKYNSGNLNFCYPKDEIFIYFLVLPISIILLVNIIVFCLVMIKISKSITRSAKQKNLQVKLAFMLWFMLGLTWFLGLMAEIITVRWLQVAFVYGFCIFGPLQGFVVFWFSVIKDKDAMTYWMKTIKLGKIEEESATTQTLALTSTSTDNKYQ